MFSVFIQWLALSALLNLVWEIAQLPLYTIYAEGDLATIAFAVGHCTAGDVFIATGTYLVAALVARSGRWPIERPGLGLGAGIVAMVDRTGACASAAKGRGTRQAAAIDPDQIPALGIGEATAQ